MPKDTNNNIDPTTNGTNIPKQQNNQGVPQQPAPQAVPQQPVAPAQGGRNTAAQNPAAQPAQQGSPVVPGSLNNAVMRTLKGDASQTTGPQASNAAVKAAGPQGSVPAAQLKQPQKPTLQEQIENDLVGPKPTSPEQKNKAVVHTFKGDVQDLVRNQKVSLAKMAALEGDRKPQENAQQVAEDPQDEQQWKTTVIVSLTLLFIVIAGVLGYGAYHAYQLNTQPNTTPQFAPAIIFTEARESIDITDKNARTILNLLATARRNTLFSLGSVVELHLTAQVPLSDQEQAIIHPPTQDFLRAINANVSDSFVRTLGPDYVLGIHVIDESVPFLILTTESYGHAFSGMIKWEQSIEENLAPFFNPNAEYTRPAIAQGENAFTDTVFENIDVRILRDENEVIRMMYAFIDRDTILITTNIRTLIELASRIRVAEI